MRVLIINVRPRDGAHGLHGKPRWTRLGLPWERMEGMTPD
jgi:hypothetical protein